MKINSTTEWARANGDHFRYWAPLDNYPVTRATAHGDAWRFVHPTTGAHGVILDGRAQFRDGWQSVYLIDDGRTVAPHYVAAFHNDHDHLILHAFPVNGGTRPDGRPADFRSWAVGPSRVYHLKITKDGE